MRHFPHNRALFAVLMVTLLTALFVPAAGQVVSDDQEQVQHQIERAKIFRKPIPSSPRSTSIARSLSTKGISLT